MNSGKIRTWRKVCAGLCAAGIAASAPFVFPAVRSAIIVFGENLAGRELNREIWNSMFFEFGAQMPFVFLACGLAVLFSDRIDMRKKIFKYAAAALLLVLFALKFIFSGLGASCDSSGANAFHAAILSVLILLAIVLVIFYDKIRVEKQFLAFWVILSAAFLFSSTPFNVPDEESHFCRAFEISQGHMLTPQNGGREFHFNGDMMTSLEENWTSFSEHRRDTLCDETFFAVFTNTALYPPLSYIPQSLGIFIARLFTRNFSVIIYSGRILSWAFVTAILFFAVKIIPRGKEIVALIALCPMNIHEAVSLSPDAQVVAVSILMTAFVLRAKISGGQKFRLNEYLVLYAAAILISMLKITYLPFCLAYLLIPQEKFGGRKRKTAHTIIIAVAVVALNVIWLNFSRQFLTKSDTNAAEQLRFILTHPLSYFLVLLKTYFVNSLFLLITMIGGRLNELNLQTSFALVTVYLGFMAVNFIPENKDEIKFDVQKFCFLVIIISVVLLISTSLYVQWTPLRNSVIDGLQGRYFLPLLFPLWFLFHTCSESRQEKCPGLVLIFLVVLINSWAAADLLGASV